MRSRSKQAAAAPPAGHASGKLPFDVPEVFRRLRAAVKPYPEAAMFVLFDEGYRSVFEILVSCVISIRTTEEVTLPTSRKLFAVARTPRQVAALTPGKIDDL
ncbi:MAG: Endonuclease, partial [Phycisphaerales bacterium]|nr:Endonuclease [Phycisphaerales bacterium]